MATTKRQERKRWRNWRRHVQAQHEGLRRGKRKKTTAVEMAAQAAAVMAAAMAVRAVQDGTMRLTEAGRKGF
jgi:hypothetical protein